MAIAWGKLIETAKESVWSRIKANGAIEMAGTTMLREDVNIMRRLKGALHDEDIMNKFNEFGISYETATKRYLGSKAGKLSISEREEMLDDLIDNITTSFMNGFDKASGGINLSTHRRGNGIMEKAEGWGRATLNYYGLQDLQRAGKLGLNKETMKTAGLRYGATTAGVWGTSKVVGGIFGGDD